jgi:hypothetical protein
VCVALPPRAAVVWANVLLSCTAAAAAAAPAAAAAATPSSLECYQVAKQYFKKEGEPAAPASDSEGYDSDVGAGSSGWKKSTKVQGCRGEPFTCTHARTARTTRWPMVVLHVSACA